LNKNKKKIERVGKKWTGHLKVSETNLVFFNETYKLSFIALCIFEVMIIPVPVKQVQIYQKIRKNISIQVNSNLFNILNFFCLIRVCYCNVNFLLEHMNLVQAHKIFLRD
jgi:hypothetical protein